MESIGVALVISLATLILSALGLKRKGDVDYVSGLEKRAERLQADLDRALGDVEKCDEEKELMRTANAELRRENYDLLAENRAQAQEIRELRRRTNGGRE